MKFQYKLNMKHFAPAVVVHLRKLILIIKMFL